MNQRTSISATLIPEQDRLNFTAKLFGVHYPFKLEPLIFQTADSLSTEYDGGFWEFYSLSNGGFYMAPVADKPYLIESPNGHVCYLSPDAFGITCCLFAYSMLSFEGTPGFSVKCAEHFHLLREYMLDHAEAGGILGAVD